MIKIFNRGNKKEKEMRTEEALVNMALADVSKAENVPQEVIQSIGQSAYMIMDPDVTDLLRDDEQLKHLQPAFSHVNRTTNIGKREIELQELQYDYIMLVHKVSMNEDNYESSGWAKLIALRIFADGILSDANHGWKGKLVTDQIKTLRTILERRQKKGWLR